MGMSSRATKPAIDSTDDVKASNDGAVAAVAGAATIGGVAGATALASTIVGMGFSPGGVVAGTAAAAMMSAEAIAAGGGVMAGGTVATLQSVGALGVFGGAGIGFLLYSLATIAGAVTIGAPVLLYYQHIAPKPIPFTPPQGRSTIRNGEWTVATEEGPGNVKFYHFNIDLEARAWAFFSHGCIGWLSRIIFNPEGRECACAGWNPFAHHTVRKRYWECRGASISDCDGRLLNELIPGTTVALYSPSQHRYIRMVGEIVDAGDGSKKDWDTPLDPSECFLVVDAGNSEVALYNCQHRRFIRLHDSDVDAKGEGGEREAHDLPAYWTAERFAVIDAGNGRIALHNKTYNRFVRLWDNKVNAFGGRCDIDSLPNDWRAEKFFIRDVKI
jgi:hypothetical protein